MSLDKGEIEVLCQADFTAQSGTLSDQLNELWDDFQIPEADMVNNWWSHVECGTWKDLIDWLWGLLKKWWDEYFG